MGIFSGSNRVGIGSGSSRPFARPLSRSFSDKIFTLLLSFRVNTLIIPPTSIAMAHIPRSTHAVVGPNIGTSICVPGSDGADDGVGVDVGVGVETFVSDGTDVEAFVSDES